MLAIRQCIICDKEFSIQQYDLNRGRGRFCSRTCASTFARESKPLEQRFWAKVDRSNSDGCWVWTGATQSPFGYGSFNRGSKNNKSHTDVAHRVSYELTYGAIPQGLFVCHHCDNPRCVRPDHLFLGTHTDNMQDMHRKGRGMEHTKPERYARGEHQHLAKLTDDDVRTIRAIYEPGIPGYSSSTSMTSLARRYRVSKSTMAEVVKGVTWKHVT